MTKVIFDVSMSLDGFMTASNLSADEPMGDGGQQLHDWARSDKDARGVEVLKAELEREGATITGRRTYDTSIRWWGADGPSGAARVPVIVVSHSTPESVPTGGVYTFIDGIEDALEAAKRAAGHKDVSVMGGAQIGQQFIKAGLVDEIFIHLVPVLFGNGTRMFDHIGGEHIQLETTEVVDGPTATHLRFRVLNEGASNV